MTTAKFFGSIWPAWNGQKKSIDYDNDNGGSDEGVKHDAKLR